jgi:hypothetical protein
MAGAVEVDTLQGSLGDSIWFHFDLDNDVLYLRDQATRNEPVFGEEDPDGFTVLRTDDGKFAGMTIVTYWERFGSGELGRASIHAVKERVAEWAKSHSLVA